MSFKYMPVLRSRENEKRAFKNFFDNKIFSSNTIIPLIEIIQYSPNRKNTTDSKLPEEIFEESYVNEFKNYDFPIIVDIPMYIDLNSNIKQKYKDFLSEMLSNSNKKTPSKRLIYFNKLSKLKNIIPVVSYNPNAPYPLKTISTQEKYLRTNFNKIAFRVFVNINTITHILNEVEQSITSEDILILDLQDDDYKETKFNTLFQKIEDIKTSKKCKTIILNTPITEDIIKKNKNVQNDCPINAIDNSIVFSYKSFGFDAFGDYAGIKKYLGPDNNGNNYNPPVTYNIFYAYHQNKYIKFKSQTINASKPVVAPSITKSKCWNMYGHTHHKNCPGCIEINNKSIDTSKPGNWGTWQAINIQHYIYTMNDFL
ncbi:beta family protein [Tepidibacter sp. Z1-5]|uniref:beta family protein n=1 Tax=Tepidibacter sp. Z1-5 TaxID=3134138 RepID=UPI0030C47553